MSVSFPQQIANLQQQLSNPALTPSKQRALQNRIAAKQAKIARLQNEAIARYNSLLYAYNFLLQIDDASKLHYKHLAFNTLTRQQQSAAYEVDDVLSAYKPAFPGERSGRRASNSNKALALRLLRAKINSCTAVAKYKLCAKI